MENKEIASFLKSLRIAHGYTQQAVADKLFLSAKTISKWETGEGIPDITVLPALADLYGVSVDEILRGRKSPDKGESAPETKTKKANAHLLEASLTHKFAPYFWTSFGIVGVFVIATLLTGFLGGTNGAVIAAFILSALAIIIPSLILKMGYDATYKTIEYDEDKDTIDEAVHQSKRQAHKQIFSLVDSFVVIATFWLASFLSSQMTSDFSPITALLACLEVLAAYLPLRIVLHSRYVKESLTKEAFFRQRDASLFFGVAALSLLILGNQSYLRVSQGNETVTFAHFQPFLNFTMGHYIIRAIILAILALIIVWYALSSFSKLPRWPLLLLGALGMALMIFYPYVDFADLGTTVTYDAIAQLVAAIVLLLGYALVLAISLRWRANKSAALPKNR